MATKRGTRVAVVVEDQRLERFCRETLKKFGYASSELRVSTYPVGQGSAKQWVDHEYPKEVAALRRRSYQRGLAVVVGTDADELTVNGRADRLDQALISAGAAPRKKDERIVHWIPKWNIETWLLYFAGQPRDEDHDYKGDVKDVDYAAVAAAFVDEYRRHKANANLSTQPSLAVAYRETRRLGV